MRNSFSYTEQNYSLSNLAVACSIHTVATTNCNNTTTVTGYRTRQTCGFFVPQIPALDLLNRGKAEFVARSIRRNKVEHIRTNKASRVTAVVEALPHLLQVGKSFTKHSYEKSTMKHPITTGLCLACPIVFNSAMEGRSDA
ncbi:hypothetical protein A4G19_15485 [Pasteurellaceae bacterium Macca]|nr:hypothetical protein [Pasteurellaceae bacterium Macca]